MIEPTDEMERAFEAAWAAVEAAERVMGCAEHDMGDCPYHEVPGARLRAGLTAVLAIVFRPDPHLYLSTGCLHDTEEGHAYCRVEARRYDGSTKTASTCKFCGARCVCPCHREAS